MSCPSSRKSDHLCKRLRNPRLAHPRCQHCRGAPPARAVESARASCGSIGGDSRSATACRGAPSVGGVGGHVWAPRRYLNQEGIHGSVSAHQRRLGQTAGEAGALLAGLAGRRHGVAVGHHGDRSAGNRPRRRGRDHAGRRHHAHRRVEHGQGRRPARGRRAQPHLRHRHLAGRPGCPRPREILPGRAPGLHPGPGEPPGPARAAHRDRVRRSGWGQGEGAALLLRASHRERVRLLPGGPDR